MPPSLNDWFDQILVCISPFVEHGCVLSKNISSTLKFFLNYLYCVLSLFLLGPAAKGKLLEEEPKIPFEKIMLRKHGLFD